MFIAPKGPKKIRKLAYSMAPDLRVTCDKATYELHSKETIKEMKKAEPATKLLLTLLKVW
jgi:hypothetical protein